MDIKTKIKSEATVFVAVLAGILLFANILSIKFFVRGDLTDGKQFTLSDASVRLVSKLDDKLIVKAFFTKNLPGQYATLERAVRDLLEEYQQNAGGKMSVEFIDPTGNEEEEKVATSLGINKMPNPDIEKDQATVKEGFRGIAFSFADKSEVIPAVESPVGLEYEITSTLKKILGQKTEIGFLVGHGEPEIEPPPEQRQQAMMNPNAQGAYRNLRHNLDTYNYRQIDLKKGETAVPDEVKALFVAGTKDKLTDGELYRLDQFLMRGGSIAFFVDGVTVSVQAPQYPGMPPSYSTAVNESGLREMLKTYGVDLGRSLVMDAQAANYPARCPPIPLPLPRPYPAWPIATSFADNSPLTYRLGSLTLPYASTATATKEAKADSKLKAQELAFSSGNTWTVAGESANVDPCAIEVSKNLESNLPLAVSLSGTFTSHFKGKPRPPQGDQKEGDKAALDKDASFLETSKAPGRIIVVGSSGLPGDESLSMLARLDRRQAMNNFTFVQNALDWMTNEDGLIAVRMKTADDPPLREVAEGVKNAAKYGNIIGIPLALALFGVVRWRVRAGKGKKAEKKS